ncbi:hypothetical protein SCHPADRAFT_132229 [Schizopora paradoxa]|uniref:UBC core domain-containing protein n=1 Tax=Schizopora paradoxa TaxID=27342 RepID=A0A0H2SM61_9AGAM|nr:hypothetical protein SCHPADRAFT_132229 [Schizopora paradoxa]
MSSLFRSLCVPPLPLTTTILSMEAESAAHALASQSVEKNTRPLFSLHRLHYDLARMEDDMPRGIRVVTDDSDMSRFCLVLEPQEGYLEGCRIHLSISIPDYWPCVPLSARIDTPFEHPNVVGDHVCCEILHSPESRFGYYDGGYSPALSLAGTFSQLASLFSSSSDGHTSDRIGANEDMVALCESLIRAGDSFDCKFCNWKRESNALNSSLEISPKVVDFNRPRNANRKELRMLDALSPEALQIVISNLDVASLHIFGSVYDRAKKLISESNETKHGPRDAILGIGLWYDTDRRALASKFDFISKFAYEHLHIRKDAAGSPFDFWMPLSIDDSHYAKASKDIQQQLVALEDHIPNEYPNLLPLQGGLHEEPVRHLMRMANAIVVDFMKTCDVANLSSPTTDPSSKATSSLLGAAERAITGYCSIVHLIASYALENPRVITDVHDIVNAFINSAPDRSSNIVRDLGVFMIQLSLDDTVSWSVIRPTFIAEMFRRFVVLQIRPTPNGAGLTGLVYLEDDEVCEWRIKKTFEVCRSQLRLFFLQLFFMEKLAKREGSTLSKLRDELDARQGIAPSGLTAELLERIQLIYQMDRLEVFAQEAGYPMTPAEMTGFLRRCVEAAGRGYYRSTEGWSVKKLQAYRARDDEGFREKQFARGIFDVASDESRPTFYAPSSKWNSRVLIRMREKKRREAKEQAEGSRNKELVCRL